VPRGGDRRGGPRCILGSVNRGRRRRRRRRRRVPVGGRRGKKEKKMMKKKKKKNAAGYYLHRTYRASRRASPWRRLLKGFYGGWGERGREVV